MQAAVVPRENRASPVYSETKANIPRWEALNIEVSAPFIPKTHRYKR